MNCQRIVRSLRKAGFNAELAEAGSQLRVEFQVNSQPVMLVHQFPDDLLRVPKFYLADGHGFGKLAHVLPRGRTEGGEVCIADVASTSVNRDRPALVYRETVSEHVDLLTRLITDPAYNRIELLREFGAHWKVVCRTGPDEINEIFVAWDGLTTDRLQVRLLPQSPAENGLQARPLALAGSLANEHGMRAVHAAGNWSSRPKVGRGVGVRLASLVPAPATTEEAPSWYFKTVSQADSQSLRALAQLHRKRSHEYWVVMSSPIPGGGLTLAAVRWSSAAKRGLPKSMDEALTGGWTAAPFNVRSLSRESLVPRGGGSLDFRQKSVLLVGCGSVGSELACGLASIGIGKLKLVDPDILSEENLFRHRLTLWDVGAPKGQALARHLGRSYPWIEAKHCAKRLQDLRDKKLLGDVDLVVVAIGSPTVERAFAEFCTEAQVGVPIIYTWLEGYGIGGHAILAVPTSRGCWHCAYVDPATGKRGLSSSLNFLAPNQVVMRDMDGCGAQFLPFSGLAAARTGWMAAELAAQFLGGKTLASTRVSWRGNAKDATDAALKTTPRFQSFTESWRTLPLHDSRCDVCQR